MKTRLVNALNFFIEKPLRGLLLLMIVQVAGWGIMTIFFAPLPHFDVIMFSLLGRDGDFWQIHGHPPLANAIIYFLNGDEPLRAWIHPLAAQFFALTSYAAAYCLALALLKNKTQALCLPLLMAMVEYLYGKSTAVINHDVVQYPFWLVVPLLTLYATRPLAEQARQHQWWWLLGITMGVALWTKHSIILLLAMVPLWTLMDKEARRHLKTPHPYSAALLCLLIGGGALWGFIEQWQNVQGYVTRRLDEEVRYFLLDFFIVMKFVLLASLLARLLSLKTRLTYPFASMSVRETNFLLLFALAPAVLPFLGGYVLLSQSIKMAWLLPMAPLWCLLLLAVTRGSWRGYSAHVILACAMIVSLRPFYYYPVRYGLYGDVHRHEAIAERVLAAWREDTNDAPLNNVVGNIGKLGGLVTLYGEAREILDGINTSMKDEASLRQEGALFIYDAKDDHRTTLRKTLANLQAKEQSFSLDNYPHEIYYAIVPPS